MVGDEEQKNENVVVVFCRVSFLFRWEVLVSFTH